MRSLYGQPWGSPKREIKLFFFNLSPHFSNFVWGKCGSGKYIVSIKPDLSEGKCVITARTVCTNGCVTLEVTCMQVGHSHGSHFHLQSCPTPPERWSKMFGQDTHSNRLSQSSQSLDYKSRCPSPKCCWSSYYQTEQRPSVKVFISASFWPFTATLRA